MTDGDRMIDGSNDHIVTVREWKDGKPREVETLMRLPERLGNKDKPLHKNSLVVFYDKKHFQKEGEDRTFFRVTSYFEEKKNLSKSEVEKAAAELSLLSKRALIEKVGCNSLGELEVGAVFTVLSVKSVFMGEGQNRYEALIGTVVHPKQFEHDVFRHEEMIFPARFKSVLNPSRLPLLARYNGKKFNKQGDREYFDVSFMATNEKRLTNLCLSQYKA